MIDIDDIRRAGVSPTRTGRLTNPVRRLLWPLVRPWLQGLLEKMREAHLAARSMSDALRKDQMAIAHRLASIETQLASVLAELAETRRELAEVRARQG